MLITNLLLFLSACVVLVISGTFLVKSLSRIASYLHTGEFVVGFIIMAFATSIPELFVGISSSLTKNTALALGTVIGSNIADLALVGGLAIMLAKGITIKSEKTKTDALYMVGISLLPLILMLIGKTISRIDGIILLVVFFVYARKLFKERKIFKKEIKNRVKRWEPVLNTTLFIISLVLLFFSAEFVVKYAALLSVDLALPSIIIGLFLIAIGTSLPELGFSLPAVSEGKTEMMLGDLIGSVVCNSTLVLGVTSIIYPITADFLLFITSGFFMITIAFLFATFVESGSKLYWKEGVSLILLYMFFIIIEFYVKVL